MGLVKEFKDFAMKGNVVDMAVGIIIGAGFGKIVSSLVADIIMPPIGKLIGGVKFSDMKTSLGAGEPTRDAAGNMVPTEVFLNYGNFLQTVFDFMVVAVAVFAMIRIMNTARARFEKQAAAAPAVPVAPPEDILLLREIRDALKKEIIRSITIHQTQCWISGAIRMSCGLRFPSITQSHDDDFAPLQHACR